MASTIKVNNIQNQCGANIANKCGTTITLGASGDTITLACGASQTGFGRTGTVDWDTTAKTASFTAVSGNGYFVNTTSGAVTVTLPAGSAGDIVSLADYTNTWQTNNVTVAPNGTDKIGGVTENAILSTEGQSVTFVYVDATEGWKNVQDSTSNVTGNPNLVATGGTITYCGDYKIHTFTGPGTFTVCKVSQTVADNTVSYLVVAGGGSGGEYYGGGAGAGGFREYKNSCDPYTASPLNGNPGGTAVTVTAQAYPITVGAGGADTAPQQPGNNGSNSVFSTITSTGGGFGAGSSAPSGSAAANGGPGGSGGAGVRGGTAGSGNTPPVSPPQGNDGGAGSPNSGSGGGAGATGSPSDSGTGGAGVGTLINPATGESGPSCLQYYSGGGGAAGAPTQGGIGGGGGNNPGEPGAGSANTGGGGAGNTDGGGGSGIVIIRYKYQ
jgi:hypothetical protein